MNEKIQDNVQLMLYQHKNLKDTANQNILLNNYTGRMNKKLKESKNIS